MAAMSRLSEHTLRTAASMSAPCDDLQILNRYWSPRTFLGDHSGVAEAFGAFDDVAREPAVLHGVDPVLPTGGGVVANGGGRVQERLARSVVEEAGARFGVARPISTISPGE